MTDKEKPPAAATGRGAVMIASGRLQAHYSKSAIAKQGGKS